jgi:SAM-dependent methyltransferase
MIPFNHYARYYDLLYQDKDYPGEVGFIRSLLTENAPQTKTLLDLGSGTGRHAELLAEHGYTVHGVELSQAMLERAQTRCADAPQAVRESLSFSQGDLRSVELGQQFDAVLSLFHVISYQTTNADLHAALRTVKQHLKPGGVFLFDVWYGPAVLTEKPLVRIKRLEDERIQVTRLAEPVLDVNANRVDVNYTILVRDKVDGRVEETHEIHPMRYFFKPELELLFEQYGFAPLTCGEWLSNKRPGVDTWGVYWLVRSE